MPSKRTWETRHRSVSSRAALAVVLLAPAAAAAQPPAEPAVNQATPVPAAAAPAAPPAPYSLPWQLRPATVGDVIRSDTSLAMYKAGETSGSTVASMLLASYRITPWLAPLMRVGFVRNSDPSPTLGTGSAFVNPILGVTGGWKLPHDLRLSAFLGATVPIGQGGDQAPGMNGTAAAVQRGIPARSAMDNAMFAVNYLTAIGGVGTAWVAHGLTLQGEVTLLQLTRVRNETFAPEANRTNATAGLHAGYFLFTWMSLGGEFRYQRWLSTPNAVKANPKARDTATFAVGPRFHFKVGKSTWIRPGLSFSTAADEPMTTAKYNILQLDVPMSL